VVAELEEPPQPAASTAARAATAQASKRAGE
jgi:hypothetical protein